MSTATIEAIDLAAMDWTPCCDIHIIVHNQDGTDTVTRCDQPAAYVIEVRHCDPYRLFACAPCVANKGGNQWICRICDGPYPAPVVIGKVAS